MMNRCQLTPSQQVQMKPETCRPGAVVHPTDMDIILGRGVLHANHPGNQRFYAIIDKYLPLYDAATSRADKTKVVQTIFETITSVGRFVKDDAESAACIVIETKKAKKKISHAIRFRRQAGKPSTAAEARKLKPVISSSSMPSPPLQPVKKLQEQQQPKIQSQEEFMHGLMPNSLNGLMQDTFAATRNRVSATSLDCIIPDEELESVLLLPADEMEVVSQTYGNLLWKDLNEDKLSDAKKVVDAATPCLKLRNENHKDAQKSSPLRPIKYGVPEFRPLPLPPRFVSKAPAQPIGCSVDPIPPPPCFTEDPLDLSQCLESEDLNQLMSLCLGEDTLSLPPRFSDPSFQ